MELNTYTTVVRETGIVPEHIYARCSSLTAFTFASSPVRRRTPGSAPKPGQKPMRKRKK